MDYKKIIRCGLIEDFEKVFRNPLKNNDLRVSDLCEVQEFLYKTMTYAIFTYFRESACLITKKHKNINPYNKKVYKTKEQSKIRKYKIYIYMYMFYNDFSLLFYKSFLSKKLTVRRKYIAFLKLRTSHYNFMESFKCT